MTCTFELVHLTSWRTSPAWIGSRQTKAMPDSKARLHPCICCLNYSFTYWLPSLLTNVALLCFFHKQTFDVVIPTTASNVSMLPQWTCWWKKLQPDKGSSFRTRVKPWRHQDPAWWDAVSAGLILAVATSIQKWMHSIGLAWMTQNTQMIQRIIGS